MEEGNSQTIKESSVASVVPSLTARTRDALS